MSLSILMAPKERVRCIMVSQRNFGKFLLPMPKEAKMKNVVIMLYNMAKGFMGMPHKTPEELRADRLAKKKKKLEKQKTPISEMFNFTKFKLFQKVACRFNGIPIEGEKHSPEALLTTIYGTTFGEKYTPPDFKFPELPKDYKDNSERDLVKYPYLLVSPFPPKHRLTVFPESWFKALEPITGTSGGYLLAFGVLAFVINKEFLIWPLVGLPQTWFVWFAIMLFLLRYRIQQQIYAKAQNHFAKHNKIIQDDLLMVKNFRKVQADRLNTLTAAKNDLPRILRETLNKKFQQYKIRNLEILKNELKQHLIFIKESELEKQRIARNLYIRSIIDGVTKQIETNHNGIKDRYMEHCIKQLDILASRPNPLG